MQKKANYKMPNHQEVVCDLKAWDVTSHKTVNFNYFINSRLVNDVYFLTFDTECFKRNISCWCLADLSVAINV